MEARTHLNIEFNEEKHEYRLNGEVVPSVTHICRFLNYDAAVNNSNPWMRDYAADRGTRVHAYTVAVDYGETLDEVDADCVGCVEAYIRFLRDFKPTWTGIERIVANELYGYAGTLDRVGTIGGNGVLLDIKTGSRINHAYCAAQLQLYDDALSDMGDESVRKLLVLQLAKDGTYKLFDMTNASPQLSGCLLALSKHINFKGESL